MELWLLNTLFAQQRAAGYVVNEAGVVLDAHILYQYPKDANIPTITITGAEILPGQWDVALSFNYSKFGCGGPVSARSNKFHSSPEEGLYKEYHVYKGMFDSTAERRDDVNAKDLKSHKAICNEIDKILEDYFSGESRLEVNTKREVFYHRHQQR